MKVLVVCGATASGKTKLAVDCALKLDTEVISADSQLIYKGLNIGTAKPSMEEPSNMHSLSSAFSSWLTVIATFFRFPKISVN